ncbi:hypothetical protein LCGC14_0145970 [marine sediment metagenome]|uniref:Uncharacterized protein n=1 Tax=marine sediment metagenome TaxID=412755 RepID=A0A0F9XHD3_9ZZZZ
MEFFQTVIGKRFYEGTAPKIANALERIATALERGRVDDKEAANPISNILANIHGDGGHHESEYGTTESLKQAAELLKSGEILVVTEEYLQGERDAEPRRK